MVKWVETLVANADNLSLICVLVGVFIAEIKHHGLKEWAWGRKGLFHLPSRSPAFREVKAGTLAGICRHELMQRPWSKAAYRLASTLTGAPQCSGKGQGSSGVSDNSESVSNESPRILSPITVTLVKPCRPLGGMEKG